MHTAINGHIPIVEVLLHTGAAVNQTSDDGMTTLMLAAHHGHIAMAMTLLGNGAHIDAACEDGTTALMFAVMQNEADCAFALIDAGASITLRNDRGQTVVDFAADWLPETLVQQLPLHAASRTLPAQPDNVLELDMAGIDLQRLHKLLVAGANSNLKDKHGNTALSFSTNNSDADVVELWLAHGAGTDGRARSKRFFQGLMPRAHVTASPASCD